VALVVLGEEHLAFVAELRSMALGTQSFSFSQIGIALEKEGRERGKVAGR
jgi:hypothetical protein